MGDGSHQLDGGIPSNVLYPSSMSSTFVKMSGWMCCLDGDGTRVLSAACTAGGRLCFLHQAGVSAEVPGRGDMIVLFYGSLFAYFYVGTDVLLCGKGTSFCV